MYKAKIVQNCSWQQFSTCALTISVGQPYHEEEKLKAAVAWAGQRFERCFVYVADTLQRHNLVLSPDYSLKFAYQIAKKKGDDWIFRNRDVLKSTIVKRWNDWLSADAFKENHDMVKNLYLENVPLQAAVNADITNYLNKHMKDFSDLPFRRQQCLKYILEELAVMNMWGMDGTLVEIYPGSELQSARLLREMPFAPAGLKNRKFLGIDFNRCHGIPDPQSYRIAP